jgi:hypothetical protein
MTEFIVTRTSQNDHDPPCKEATRREVDAWMYWSFKTVAAAKRHHPEIEFVKVKGVAGVRSRQTVTAWFLTLDSLDDLLAFIGRYGRVVVGSWWRDYDRLCIEIYDDWRE